MKKVVNIARYLAVSLFAAVSVSCNTDIMEEHSGLPVQKTFIAYADSELDAPVKTTLAEDFSIRWSMSDYIKVFAQDGSYGVFAPVSVDETGKIASFNGNVQMSDIYYAVYPSSNASYDAQSGVISSQIKTVQPVAEGSFADGVNLAVGKSVGDNLYFKNVGALLAIKCPTNYASRVKLISRDPSMKMSGEALISYNNGNPVAVPADDAANYVQMDGISSKYEKTLYFVVYPGYYSKGFDLVFLNGDKTHASILSSTKPLEVKRNSNTLLYSAPFVGWNAPVAPTSLSAQFDGSYSIPGMRFSWIKSSSAEGLLKGHEIFVRESYSVAEPVSQGEVGRDGNNFFITSLVPGRTYDFGVRSVGTDGKKNSEIVWLEKVLYELPYTYPTPYPFEQERGAVPQLADMTLCYGGNPTRVPALWDKARWKTHAVYTDETGKESWLFDSFLALEFKTMDNGIEYVYDLANTETLSAGKNQWIQQLEYWFADKTGFQALDDCIEDALSTAGPYPRKRYVVFSLPDPIYFQAFADKNSSTIYWGDIDGEVMDFSLVEHRQKAYIWMVNQVRRRFIEKNYRHIELAGFYILQECLSEKYNPQYKKFEAVISQVAKYCRNCNEGLYWIPYGFSSSDEGHNTAIKEWSKYGFTATILQPNKYWDSWRDWGEICSSYIYNNGLGMEFEFEGSHGEGGWSSSETPRVSSSILETVMTNYDAQGTPKGSPNPQAARNKARFREYMVNCKNYNIYGNRMLVLYTGTNAWAELATSTAPADKELYHETCRFFLNSPLKQTKPIE